MPESRKGAKGSYCAPVLTEWLVRTVLSVSARRSALTVSSKGQTVCACRCGWRIVTGEPISPVIALRKGTGSRFRNASGDSETIGSAKRSVNKIANTGFIPGVFRG
jgi:hypothetical protein